MTTQELALENLGGSDRASWILTRLMGIDVHTLAKCGPMEAEYYQSKIDSAPTDSDALNDICKSLKKEA